MRILVLLLASSLITATLRLVVPFDEARSAETPEEFVESVLVECLDHEVVVRIDAHISGNLRVAGRKDGREICGGR